MPTVRYPSRGEGEALEGGQRRALSGESARVLQNVQLADHMGRFLAGEILKQYGTEDLGSLINQPSQVAIRVSWG